MLIYSNTVRTSALFTFKVISIRQHFSQSLSLTKLSRFVFLCAIYNKSHVVFVNGATFFFFFSVPMNSKQERGSLSENSLGKGMD